MIVVDTSVIAELMRPTPNAAVVRWSVAQAASDLYTTAITLAEVFYGIERLPAGRRRTLLQEAASEVFTAFADHVLPFDAGAAAEYSLIVDARQRLGRPIDGFDAQIASICRYRRSLLATRNAKDFEHSGIDLIDPWGEARNP